MDFTAVCVCCHQDKNLKDLWSEEPENSKQGGYGQMLIQCFGLSEASKICLECVSRMRNNNFNSGTGGSAAAPSDTTEIIIKVEPWSYEDDPDPLETDTCDNERLIIDENNTLNHNCKDNEHDIGGNEEFKETIHVNKGVVDVTGVNEKGELYANNSETGSAVETNDSGTTKDDDCRPYDLRGTGTKRRARRTKCTKEELGEVLDAVKNGKMSSKEAEEKLHCTRQTVRRMLGDVGYKRRKFTPKYTEDELAEVVSEVVQRKISCNQALAKLQCSRRVLKKEFQKIGFKPTASAFQPYSTEHLKEVLAAVADNRMTFADGLESLQCSRQTLKRRLNEYIATGDVDRYVTAAPRLKNREMDDNMKQILDDVANKRMPIERAKVLLGCGQETLKKKLLELYGIPKPLKEPSRNDIFIEEMKAVLRHTNATPFKMTPGKLCACAYCPFPAKVIAEQRGNAEELRKHVWTEHADTRVDGVARMIMIERLQVIKLDVSDLRCTVCDIELSWIDMLPHLETVHSVALNETRSRVIPFNLTTKPLINCVLCPQSFTSLNLVNHHMNTHCTAHTCKICNTTFMSAILLKTHERRIHMLEKKYYCEACEKEFTHRNNFVKHNYNTHGKGRKKRAAIHKCEYCGLKFYTNQKLSQHIMEEHESNKYPCDLCPNKSFETRSSYLKHIRLLHKGLSEKYECKLCDRKFHLPCLLRDHEDWHNDHQDYVCKTCGMKFVSKKFAKLHRKTHSEVIYECDLCDAKFKSKSGLTKHVAAKHKQDFQMGVENKDKERTFIPRVETSECNSSTSIAIKQESDDSASTPKVTKRNVTDSAPIPKITIRARSDSVATSKVTTRKRTGSGQPQSYKMENY